MLEVRMHHIRRILTVLLHIDVEKNRLWDGAEADLFGM